MQGAIVAGSVTLGRKSHAEEVWGRTVEVGADAEVRRIVAETVVLERDAHVGHVEYVGELSLGRGARIDEPPVKLASLPAFPL